MNTSPTAVDLIDKAAKIAGSDYRLAKQIGVSPQRMSDWRAGRQSPGVEYRALMADIAGLDVDQVMREALLEKHANTPLGERLLSVLGNAVHGVAAITLTSASVAYFAMGVLADQCQSLTMCIM